VSSMMRCEKFSPQVLIAHVLRAYHKGPQTK
jgi:hypothetical protein